MPADALLEVNDRIEIQPTELHDLFIEALKSSLSKSIATDAGTPRTQTHETAHQEAISALVGAARGRGISTIKMIVMKPDGRRVVREISVDKISKDRVLQ